MGVEIERKFLVAGDFLDGVVKSHRIRQGYLSVDPARTVRVRVQDDTQAFLTVKGKKWGNYSCIENEYPIPVADGWHMLEMCVFKVDKLRNIVPHGPYTYEVDFFLGENKGLVLAEVELKSEASTLLKPDWLGEEVSHDHRYSSAYLAQHSFLTWS